MSDVEHYVLWFLVGCEVGRWAHLLYQWSRSGRWQRTNGTDGCHRTDGRDLNKEEER